MSPGRRLWATTAGVVALLLLGVGVIYLTVQCQHIPSPLPGREAGSTKHRIGFAGVSLGLAAIVAGSVIYAIRPRSTPS